ncbi:MAG: glycogen debranching protein GlgX [Planctomycetota bacterium]|nr:glycogen debranching protein GlgX [Planctomycetota bacterium]
MLKRTGRSKDSYCYQPPFGALIDPDGIHFSVFSQSATAMRVLLYACVDDREPTHSIELDPQHDKIGNVWNKFLPNLASDQLYHFQAVGPYRPENGLWFDGNARLIDPYCNALAGDFQTSTDGVIRPPKCVAMDHAFDWQSDRPLKIPIQDSILYEMHLAGLTKHPSSGVSMPGTYLGAIEKIPYLKDLGITAVELLPIQEFPILDFHGQTLKHQNYWGYDPLALFAPHRGYSHAKQPGAQVHEFKTMVREFHKAGIEVVLDVVFNHSCEGGERGPVLSMKGLENPVYYLLNSDGAHYSNYSGCGNTINCNHPICREWILHCLRHWVHNYHIDGFRFDLASILSRDRTGHLLPHSPLVELISEDPMLADTKLIAEAWDAAGAYQVGAFGGPRWSEWNGLFRDDIRKFWRGDEGRIGILATRLCGSSDLYEPSGRKPTSSINFITSHDGFTLNDLVSYQSKHNEPNGENNRDGENNNYSLNHGVEGPSTSKPIRRKRTRQLRNLLATLLLSQGVPMLLMGDEIRRTQQGNNNAYCQDNPVSWFDWRPDHLDADLLRFTKALIALRHRHPTLRRTEFLTGKPYDNRGLADISWYDPQGSTMNWSKQDAGLVCWLTCPIATDPSHENHLGDILILLNPSEKSLPFVFPMESRLIHWQLFLDTAKQPPNDIFPSLVLSKPAPADHTPPKSQHPSRPADGSIRLMNRSMMVWIEKR